MPFPGGGTPPLASLEMGLPAESFPGGLNAISPQSQAGEENPGAGNTGSAALLEDAEPPVLKAQAANHSVTSDSKKKKRR
jgi:hypothetical protein